MSELTTYPEHLRYALGLADPELPGALETRAGVLPTVDVLRGGLGSLPRREFNHNVAAGTFAAWWSVTTSGNTGLGLQPDAADEGYAALYWFFAVNGGGNNIDVAAAMYPGNGFLTQQILSNKVVAQSSQWVGHKELLGTPRGLYVPPGGALTLFNGDTGAATLNWWVAMYQIPVGWSVLPF